MTVGVDFLDTAGVSQHADVNPNALNLVQTGVVYYPNYPLSDVQMFFPYSRILLITDPTNSMQWV